MKDKPFPTLGRYRPGWFAFWVLCGLVVYALAQSMVDSIQNLNVTWLTALGSVGIILGWVFSRINQKRGWFLFLGLISGLIIITLIQSTAIGDLLRAFREAVRLKIDIIRLQKPTSNIEPTLYYTYAALYDLSQYFQEISLWVYEFIQGTGATSNLAINLFWGSIYWTVLFIAGWSLRQKTHPLFANAPVLLLCAGVLGYTRQNTVGLFIILGAILLQSVLLEHLKRELRWENEGTDFSEEIRLDQAVIALPIIAVILTISQILPNFPYQEIRDLFRGRAHIETNVDQDFSESLGLKQTPVDSFRSGTDGNLPRSHLIGSGSELSEITIMTIDIGEVFLPPRVINDRQPPKYYWFGRAYNTYTGVGWQTTPFQTTQIPPGEMINPYDEIFSKLVTQNITKTEEASQTLYAAGLPVEVDQRISAAWLDKDGAYYSARLDNRSYRVQSSVLSIPQEIFESADEQNPESIRDIYLQLPENIPERITELAARISGGLETPYAQAKAIETYLRQWEYTLDVPSPPGDRDVVDYFLFDLQRGYCDYFASAMVVLARSAGLPARLAVGYATGSYDYTRQMYIVSEANAHAWPEIYIHPFGWVPFEPTTNQSLFAWSGTLGSDPIAQKPTQQDETGIANTPWILNLLGLTVLITVIIAIGLIGKWLRTQKGSSAPAGHQLENLYQRLRNILARLFFSPGKSRTPQEYALGIIQYFKAHSKTKISSKLMLQIQKSLTDFIQHYHWSVYASQPMKNSQLKQARHDYRRVILKALIFKVVLIFE